MPGQRHGVFRKTFTYHRNDNGRVSLWLTAWTNGGSFMEKGRVWLDGQEVKALNDTVISRKAWLLSNLARRTLWPWRCRAAVCWQACAASAGYRRAIRAE